MFSVTFTVKKLGREEPIEKTKHCFVPEFSHSLIFTSLDCGSKRKPLRESCLVKERHERGGSDCALCQEESEQEKP